MTESTLAIETTIFDADPRLDALADTWDRLPEGRGRQADLYDSHAWLSAWLRVASPEQRQALRIPAVLRDGELAAALPLVVSGRQARAAGHGFRPRYRPVVTGAEPDPQDLEALAEAVAEAGYRELSLFAMPSRDPATAGLARALESRGYAVRLREGSAESLAPAGEGWDAFRAGAKKFHRTVKNFSNKAARLGPVEVEAWEAPERGASDGFARYVALHGRGWKGELNAAMRRHRQALLERTDARGWSRLYLLKVAGVDAAAILWQKIGKVAIAYSTVYDHRLAALSAGTIVMWQAHERILGASSPAAGGLPAGARSPERSARGGTSGPAHPRGGPQPAGGGGGAPGGRSAAGGGSRSASDAGRR
ncbi:MAG: GNAT family N-acetyltransferase [Acidobacteriota bacterium]|nr:GNAT family N-acetyltransferase [Acidobacteriota bacterium]